MALLLQTKFIIPRLSTTRILRPHLIDLIVSQLDQKIAILTAPPGYGKTTLMVDAARASALPVLWYQLDEGDNDPATFIAYLLQGVNQILPDVAREILHLLYSGEMLPPEHMLVLLLNELVEVEANWLLVLDDYHFVSNPTVHQLTVRLLENRPDSLKIILASRTTPNLPLHRWRARNQIQEIRAEQLRFTTPEITDWLKKVMPESPHSVAAALADKTEGWGAGLQLAINLFSESALADLEKIGGSHPYIFNYLMEEVFDKQPPEHQNFLLQTAVCHQVNAAICHDVLGITESPAILEKLLQDNLFLTRLNQDWYRYHQLFQEFLHDKLMRQNPDQACQLNLKLGQYYARTNNPEIAVQHFLKAGDFDRAADALEAFADMYIEQGRVDSLHHYLQQFNDLQTYPRLVFIFGQVLRHQGKLPAAMLQFDTVLRLNPTPELTAAALTQLASIARSRGDYQQAQVLARRAAQTSAPLHAHTLALIEQAKCEGFLEGMALGYDIARQAIHELEQTGSQLAAYQQAHLRLSFGQICWWYGEVQEAIDQCEQARELLPDTASPLLAMILFTLANPYLYQHQHSRALNYAERALEICQTLNLQEHLPTAYAVLGNVLTRVGQLARAENCLRQAIDIADNLRAASYAQVMAGGYLAYNLAAQGRIDEAQQIAQSALFPHRGQTMVYEIYVCRSVLADTCLEKEQYQQAQEIFTELIQVGETRQYRIPLGLAYFGLSYLSFLNGDDANGLRHGQLSLDLLAPTGTWELYVDQGRRARLVCQRLQGRTPHEMFVQRVLSELDQQGRAAVLSSTSGQIRVETFGTFRIWRGGQEVDPKAWVSIKARDLLAYFITFRHERIALERIIEAVWQDGESRGKTAFHTALYRLRQALRAGDEKLKFILIEAGDYRLDTAQFEIDVDEFETRIQRAEKTQDAALYRQAIDVYRGKYLGNLYYDWAVSEAERLCQLYLYALEQLRKLCVRAGNYPEALDLAQRALHENRFLEDVHCEVMEYYHHLGNRQGVIRQYHLLTEILRDELQVEPLPQTISLYQRLRQDI